MKLLLLCHMHKCAPLSHLEQAHMDFTAVKKLQVFKQIQIEQLQIALSNKHSLVLSNPDCIHYWFT